MKELASELRMSVKSIQRAYRQGEIRVRGALDAQGINGAVFQKGRIHAWHDAERKSGGWPGVLHRGRTYLGTPYPMVWGNHNTICGNSVMASSNSSNMTRKGQPSFIISPTLGLMNCK